MAHFFDIDNPLMRKLSLLFDCMLLSFLFLLCCLPVFTTGAAFSALYHCGGYLADGSDTGVRDFFHAFRHSFKRVTPVWLLILALGTLLTVNLWLIRSMPADLRFFMQTASLCLLLWIILGSVNLFSLMTLHPSTAAKTLIPRAFLFSIATLPRTVLVMAVLLTPVILLFISARLFLSVSMVFLFFWPGFTAYLHAKLLRQRLEAFEV